MHNSIVLSNLQDAEPGCAHECLADKERDEHGKNERRAERGIAMTKEYHPNNGHHDHEHKDKWNEDDELGPADDERRHASEQNFVLMKKPFAVPLEHF